MLTSDGSSTELRRTFGDLVALSALPTVWLGEPPRGIAEGLADALRRLLQAEFVHVWLDRSGPALGQDSGGRVAPDSSLIVEVTRAGEELCPDELASAIRQTRATWLATRSASPTSAFFTCIGMPLYLTAVGIGLGEGQGVLVAGSSRPSFPTEGEGVILRVGANQAAVALQGALLAEARDQALEELRSAQRSRDEFLSAAAHDLKTPLASIKALAQLLVRRLDRPDQLDLDKLRDGLSGIDASASRMIDLVGELLDHARLQHGQAIELDRSPTDLVLLAERVAADHQKLTERHTIRVDADPAELVGSWDRKRLERALANLLTNSVKYSPHGGEITVRVGREDDLGSQWAVVSIVDDGIGIPAADLPHLFEWFHRGENVVGRIDGTGIGLATVKQTVESHGGTLAVDSQEGSGTTVTVRLPLL